jgi:voltage-gated potassium channel
MHHPTRLFQALEKMMVRDDSEPPGAFQILLVALSIYVLAALFIEAAVPLRPSTQAILLHLDTGICVVFLFDFFYRFARAKKKLRFLRWGWIDLVSSIPAISVLRIGRAVRVVRVLRLLRGFRSVKTIGTVLFAQRAKGTLATATFLCVLLIVFSSVSILHVENGPESNIRGPEDALWWSVATVTTVGYGDRFPISTEGRLIGAALMLCGVGLFGILSGAFAAWFTEARESQSDSNPAEMPKDQLAILIHEVRELRAEIRAAGLTRDV